MLISNLQIGDRFLITNNYNSGEFEYLGNLSARHIKSQQIVAIKGVTVVERIMTEEIIDEIKMIC